MAEPAVRYFFGKDGTKLAYRELGSGRPLVLLHGFFSSGAYQWLHSGFAHTLAADGHRVVVPDLRAHGDSAAPHGAEHYPDDVLTDDAFALIDHLQLTTYNLGGYSLGARTVVRMLVRGAAPSRVIVAGQGLREVTGKGGTVARYLRHVFSHLGTFEPGTAEWKAEQWLMRTGGDPEALRHVLDSVLDTPAVALAGIDIPMLVVVGDRDDRDGSALALSRTVSQGTHVVVPGDHTTAITAPELAETARTFLRDQ
ncbi:alpha/beta fold hydrolase [Streptomyces flaveolus]|uniref:alpha/beta fold hydrolase n=1 Tax=Streptomyces flaveolus TaxID=67297 RepID=UPI00332AD288